MSTAPKFAHVVLQTSRSEEMQAWYCNLLDGHVVYEGHGLAFVTFDDEHHRIAFLQPPVPLDERSPKAAGMNHVAYTFPSIPSLLERYEEVKAKGIEPHVPIQHGVTTSIYYRDPDGNFVEFQADNFATPAEATAYMEGPEYDGNPVGVGFEPELMIKALHNGVGEDVLKTRAWALETSPDLPDPLPKLTS